MNFLAHYVVAQRALPSLTPAAALGNALPDLLPLAAPRTRLRLATLPRTPAATPTDIALTQGVRLHLLTDNAFHKTPAFADAQAIIRQYITEAGFDTIRTRAYFLAHVLAELALDAHLLRANPALASDFYNALDAAPTRDAARWTEQLTRHPLPHLPDVLDNFRRTQYLRSYSTDAGVAEGIHRLRARTRQPPLTGGNAVRLLRLTAQATDAMRALAPRLLAQTLAALPPPFTPQPQGESAKT